jgi:hypothetical protein
LVLKGGTEERLKLSSAAAMPEGAASLHAVLIRACVTWCLTRTPTPAPLLHHPVPSFPNPCLLACLLPFPQVSRNSGGENLARQDGHHDRGQRTQRVSVTWDLGHCATRVALRTTCGAAHYAWRCALRMVLCTACKLRAACNNTCCSGAFFVVTASCPMRCPPINHCVSTHQPLRVHPSTTACPPINHCVACCVHPASFVFPPKLANASGGGGAGAGGGTVAFSIINNQAVVHAAVVRAGIDAIGVLLAQLEDC